MCRNRLSCSQSCLEKEKRFEILDTGDRLFYFLNCHRTDSEWLDLSESSTSFVVSSENEITGRLVKEKDEGKYACEISNGISPNLWIEFEVRVSGKFVFFTKNFRCFRVLHNMNNVSLWSNENRIFSMYTSMKNVVDKIKNFLVRIGLAMEFRGPSDNSVNFLYF